MNSKALAFNSRPKLSILYTPQCVPIRMGRESVSEVFHMQTSEECGKLLRNILSERYGDREANARVSKAGH